jgi:UDP-glucose 4-epimerase
MNVINFAKYNDVKKILYSSSSSVYGDFKEHNQDSNELSPLSSYGKSKLFAEHYLSKVKKKYGIDYTILRYFNVYGEFQQEKMVIARFMNAALKNENLRVFGDGMQTRDFTFIEDVVRITINVMNADKTNSKIIDVGTGKQITMNNLASEILSLMPSSTSKLINVQEPSHRKKYEIRQRYCNTTKLNQLGYFCKTQLSEGLIATLNLTEYNK